MAKTNTVLNNTNCIRVDMVEFYLKVSPPPYGLFLADPELIVVTF